MGDLPDLKTTRELALPCPDNKKAELISELQEMYKSRGYEVLDIDGVRITFELHKWALVRASNTQPKLTARFQARDEKSLEEIVTLVRDDLKQYKYVDISDLDEGLREAIG